jgi:hypothetical protein
VTFREEHSLRVFESRVLRRILGWRRDEVTGGWRKPHEEPQNRYSPPSDVMDRECRKHAEQRDKIINKLRGLSP